MRDLASPLLTPHVVSGLTGLSPQALRRWEAYGIPSASGAGGPQNGGRPAARKRGRRLYSWRDVEQLQQAAYLMTRGSVSMAAVGRVLAQNAPAGFNRTWVAVRPKPGTVRQAEPGRGRQAKPGSAPARLGSRRGRAKPRIRSRRSRVVAVALPRSARRPLRRERPASGRPGRNGARP